MICVYPAMYNGTALLRFEIANESNPVIYIGQLSEVRTLLIVFFYVENCIL